MSNGGVCRTAPDTPGLLTLFAFHNCFKPLPLLQALGEKKDLALGVWRQVRQVESTTLFQGPLCINQVYSSRAVSVG